MPFVSVVVPVYNTAKYLERCLHSLVNQTLRNIEIIVINDGSMDTSSEIMEKFAQQFEQVRTYHQANQGISKTRNYGISLACAPYVVCIDSDDYIDENMLEQMYMAMIEQDLDIAVCDFYECNMDTGKQVRYTIPPFQPGTLKENPSLIFGINSSPWNKMYKKSLLVEHNIQFPENTKYEDAQFLLIALCHAQKIGNVQEPFVFYQVRANSETTSMDLRVYDIFKILNAIEDCIKQLDLWDIVYTYWEFFVINRLTVYNLQQAYQKDGKVANQFIEHSFAYLASKYPNWRKNVEYITNNSKQKRFIKSHEYMSKAYIKLVRIRGGL